MFRHADDLDVNEEFVGLYQILNIAAATIVAAIQDTLLRRNLKLSRYRGQCYDGASNMTGRKNGMKSQILWQEPKRYLCTAMVMHLVLVLQPLAILTKEWSSLQGHQSRSFSRHCWISYSLPNPMDCAQRNIPQCTGQLWCLGGIVGDYLK